MNKSSMGAVRDSQQAPPAEPSEKGSPEKGDFKSPTQQHNEMAAGKKRSAEDILKMAANSDTDSMIGKANSMLSGGGSDKMFEEFQELEQITPEDLELAEQIVFKGCAEKDIVIPNLPNHKFTICTTSAEEMSVVDEIIYEMVKAKEDNEGDVDLPALHVQTMRAALTLALGFKGVDDKDYCDEPINQLMTIKRAIIKVKDFEYEGDMDSSNKLNESLKKSLKRRAIRVRRLPTPVIDFLSTSKYGFDTAMLQVMMSKKLIPKSSGQSQDAQEPTSSTQASDSNSGR